MTASATTYDVIAPARAGFKRGGWMKIDETDDPLNYGSPHVRFRRQADNRLYRVTDECMVADAMIVDTRQ